MSFLTDFTGITPWINAFSPPAAAGAATPPAGTSAPAPAAPAPAPTPATAPASTGPAPAATPWYDMFNPFHGGDMQHYDVKPTQQDPRITDPNANPGGVTYTKRTDAAGGTSYLPTGYQNWDVRGRGAGNRADDAAGGANRGAGAPTVGQVDLSSLDEKRVGAAAPSDDHPGGGTGYFESDRSGSKFTPSFGQGSYDTLGQKGNIDLASGMYVAGVERKVGYRAGTDTKGEYGQASASAEAGAVGNAGVDAYGKLSTKDGLLVGGDASAKLGLYAQADANAKSNSVKFGGQDYDAGIGAHGETFAGVKAGAGAKLGLGPDFIGAQGNIGAFAGVEAAGDIHGNLGPLGAKLGASGMVGAGIGADGDISYKDGKFHIGGKLFAALGYGGSLSADMTVDFGKIGKSLANVYDPNSSVAQGAGGVLTGAGRMAGAVGSGLMAGGREALSGIGTGAHEVWDALAGNNPNQQAGLGGVVSGVGHGLYDAGAGVVHGIGTGLYTAGKETLGGIADAATGAVNVVGHLGANAYHAGSDLVHGVGQGVSDVAGGIAGGASTAAHGVSQGASDAWAAITGSAPGQQAGVGGVVSGVGHGLYEAGSGIVSGIGQGVAGVGRGVADVASGAYHAVGDLLTGW